MIRYDKNTTFLYLCTKFLEEFHNSVWIKYYFFYQIEENSKNLNQNQTLAVFEYQRTKNILSGTK